MEYGYIYTQGGATAQGSIGTSFVKLTTFASTGPENGVEANDGIDELQPLSDGVYYAFAHLGFTATVGRTYDFAISVDDTAGAIRGNQDMIESATGTATDYSVSLGGLIQLSAGDRVALMVQSNTAGSSLTLINGQLGLFKVG